MRKPNFACDYGTMLKGGVSLLALMALAAAGAVHAQAATAAPAASEGSQEVVVVGVRKALKSAQQIKKNADTQVDSITATDIGSFPDKSVAEALQRVPGITVTRFAASDDSSHFSAEPSGVLIRGLTQVRTEFNGRDSFSADGARGLNFADIAPELMAGVDSYKNQTADMIEGGVAGSVNLRTRLPFDSKGQQLAVSLNGNYGDISKKSTYDYSAIYSNRWDTPVGEFGLMADYANSHVVTATNGVIMGRIATYCSAGYSNANGVIVNADGSIPCTASPLGGTNWQYLPSNVTYSSNSYDRNRHGTALAAQWQNHEHTVLATLQYNDSYYHNKWTERTVEPIFHDLWAAPAFNPISDASSTEAVFGSSPLQFDSSGMLSSGHIAQHIQYWGNDQADNALHAAVAPGVPFVNACYDWTTCTPHQMGTTLDTSTRVFDRAEGTADLSGNLKWDVNDQIRTNFDVQYIRANQNSYDILLSPHTMADVNYSVDDKGIPQMTFSPDANNNYAAGFLGNLHNYYYGFVQDHLDHTLADELATRADVEYRFKSGGWLNSLKVGVRYADRHQKVSYSTFNWSSMYANWGCDAAYFNIDNGAGGYNTNQGAAGACLTTSNNTFAGYKPGLSAPSSFGSDFFNGHVLQNTNFAFPVPGRIGDFNGLVAELSKAVLNNGGYGQGWTPLCQRSGLITGTCYQPGEVLDLDEKTNAAYVMLKFGGADQTIFNGITVQGNVGVRYVETEDESTGGTVFPTPDWYNNASGTPCNTPILNPHQVTNISCWLTPALLAFSNGASATSSYGGKHKNWLPSFSVRFGLDDKQFIRVSGSRAMARPDIGQMRNFLSIGSPAIDTSDSSPYVIYNSPTAAHVAANVVGYNFSFAGNSGNADLAPYTADQFDLSYENYISDTTSFTLDLFTKTFNGGIGLGKYARSLTNNSQTYPILITAGANNSGGGTLKGYEIAYQTFFDFLPGLWSGFGMQANFTHVSESGINNTNLTDFPVYDGGSAAGGGGNTFSTAVIDSHRLAGISDNSYNLVGLYEKGPWAARLAYNWRSKFLVNNLDVIIGLPVYEKAAGYLDGSVRYKVNDNVEVSLEASNLGGTTAVLQQQLFGDSSATPGAKAVFKDSSWIKNDRRLQLGIRFKY